MTHFVQKPRNFLIDGIKKLVFYVKGKMIVDLSGGIPRAYIFGSPRSGTTWIMKMLSEPFRFRPLFEPWAYPPNELKYVQESLVVDPDLQEFKLKIDIENVFLGRIKFRWLDQFCSTGFYAGRIVKEVRGALFLIWIKRRYPGLPILFVIRNPFDVALSRIALKWPCAPMSLAQSFESIYPGFNSLFRSLKSILAKHVLIWTATNLTPIRQSFKGELHIVFYEDLVSDPIDKFKKIYKNFDFPDPDLKKMNAICKERSPTDFTAKINKKKLRFCDCSQEEKNEALEVLKIFDLEGLYREVDGKIEINRDVLMGHVGAGINGIREKIEFFLSGASPKL